MKTTMLNLALIATMALPSVANANGIEWSLGVAGSQPGPVRQSALYLEEEHVAMDESKVTAVFQVMNPSNQDIKTQMGFPIKRHLGSGLESDYSNMFGPEAQHECLPDLEVEVLVNEQRVSTTFTCNPNGDYPTVINWMMSYPANKMTRFTVKYPHFGSSLGGGEGFTVNDTKNWSYIVHTGSYWAKPIGKAHFEFCGEPVKTYCKDPNGITTWDADGSTQYSKRMAFIRPQHSFVDCKSSCIIWNRSNWTPLKTDDIEVAYEIITNNLYSGFIEEDPGTDLLSSLCAHKKHKHFGEVANISSTALNEENIEDVYWAAEGGGEYLPAMPDNVTVIRRLAFYRYLRNWIAAVHGHDFNDEKLKKCFESVRTEKAPYSSIELNNIQFLKKQETIWSEKKKIIWDNYKANQEP